MNINIGKSLCVHYVADVAQFGLEDCSWSKIRAKHSGSFLTNELPINRAENLPFCIDVWYEVLKEFTPRSTFLRVTIPEAQAIVDAYRLRYNIGKTQSLPDPAHLWSLREKIRLKLESFAAAGAPVFVRLSGRSLKDAEPPAGMWELYNQCTSQMTKFEAINRVAARVQCVESADEIMRLLLTSERAFSDLLDVTNHGEPEMICLREFDERILIENEFRVFIYDNQITGISQYDHYGFYPDLFDLELIEALIRDSFEKVHAKVGLTAYILDYAFLPDTKEVIVVELSPFLECTGAAMFRWERDTEVLKNGPFEFRVATSQRPGIEDLLESYEASLKNPPQPPAPVVEPRASALTRVLSLFSAAPPEEERVLLFVYGTLKTNFYWYHKYLQGASQFIRETKTRESTFGIALGSCGVPYILSVPEDRGHQVAGQVFSITLAALKDMDDYEGVTKGHYQRIPVMLEASDGFRECVAQMYAPKKSDILNDNVLYNEYTLEMQREFYQPIKHIQLKQSMYLETLQQ